MAAMMITFFEYLEGLLAPNRPPRVGLPKINSTPFTNMRRKRIAATKPRKIDGFAPTVRAIVPPHLVPKIAR